MAVIQADVSIWFTLQCEWFRLVWTSSSLYNVNDSGWCTRIAHFTMWVIIAHVTVYFTWQC